jgi:hypothetical protein
MDVKCRRYGPDQGYAECYVAYGDAEATVNVQYAVILPHGQHADGCDQMARIGGRCTCDRYSPFAGHEAEVISAARAWLAAHREPSSDPGPALTLRMPAVNDNPYMARDKTRPCSICGSYCYGDCAS